MRILIKILLGVLIVLWLYGILSYMDSHSLSVPIQDNGNIIQDNCTMNSQVNNCIVISTDK